ncbi:fluoride efflux transporter CrcB [bacterium]|nr:fluoride efflux transporter CrcB [bacterium]
MFLKLGSIALAGAAGTLLRFALSGIVQRWAGAGFPWGTLAVNVLGCFLFGVVWMLAENRLVISGETRLIVLVGFMGAFTTFSTFAFETGELLRESEYLLAAGNVLVQNGLGIVALFLGWAIGRWL